MKSIQSFSNYQKILILALIDASYMWFSYFLCLRNYFDNSLTIFYFIIFAISLSWILNVYSFSVKNCTLKDLLPAAFFIFLSSVVSAILLIWISAVSVSAVNLTLFLLLNVNSFVLSRLGLRHLYRLSMISQTVPVLFVGCDDNTENVIHSMFSSKYFKPVGIIELERNSSRKKVLGLDVFDAKNFSTAIDRHRPEIVFLPNDLIPEKIVNTLWELSLQYKFAIKKLPKIMDALLLPRSLEKIDLSVLMNRAEGRIILSDLISFYQNKVVMVTGAGGSIGSELSLQIAACNPKKIILFDISEFSIFQIHNRILDKFPGLEVVVKIGDIIEDLTALFVENEIDIVLHSAALKHVPLVESNIKRAVKTNVFGTQNLIRTASKHNVKDFILVSTDKAVRPTNIMGATKRLAELICVAYAQNKSQGYKSLCISSVRFGNVLGSSGSVLPTFEKQIAKGGPLTVTDPEITRYFMSVPEAVSLVLQSALLRNNGAVHLLDMGSPVKILDLAKSMITISGFTPVIAPEKPTKPHEVQVIFTGLRAGEKLYEELLIDESSLKTAVDKIRVAYEESLDLSSLDQCLMKLEKVLVSGSDADLRRELQSLPLNYKPIMS